MEIKKDLRKIQDVDLKNKRVLVRVDFNVELENSDVMEKFKILATGETINYLLKQGGVKMALISHLGRPDGKVVPGLSLAQITDDLERILGIKVKFSYDCVGEKVKNSLDNLKDDEVLLLENVRFYPEEENNDEEFSKKLSANFDIFINDAFSVSHRNQSSVTGVAKILPSYAGFQMQREVENLNKVIENPIKPSLAIIGGAKIETKLPLIEKFQKIYDTVLIGGKIANEAEEQGLKFESNVMIPVDFAKDKLDIGPESIKQFKETISHAKTIVWNGPMGKFEEQPYDTGTNEILSAVISSGAFSVMGGGESIQILEESNNLSKISFVSTGGGAMLEYLTQGTLPGIDALRS